MNASKRPHYAWLVCLAYFGLARASSFLACSVACAVLGTGYCLCGPVPGMLADAFGGSYLPSYLLFIVLLAVSLILLRIVYGQLGAGKRR